MHSDRIQRRIDALLDEADQALADHQWAAARDSARAVLGMDPANADALAYLAAAESALNHSPTTPLAPGPPSATHGPVMPIATQPESFANGRYQVAKFLGEGGKKRV